MAATILKTSTTSTMKTASMISAVTKATTGVASAMAATMDMVTSTKTLMTCWLATSRKVSPASQRSSGKPTVNVVAVAAGGANTMVKLEEQFKRHLQRGRFFDKNDRVVIAVSTGVDSMALLSLVTSLPASLRPAITVAHVNHELRRQSQEEEAYLRRYCQKHQLALLVKHWPRATHPQTGIEAAARRFRYQFFAEVMAARQSPILLTAHHQNDLAETMLMKLVRGGQLNQLVGIEAVRSFAGGRLVRPLLPFSKQQLRAYAVAKGIRWYEDATNQDLTISRNRYRYQLLPALEKENPRLLQHLASYHQQLAALLAWQNQEVQAQLAQVAEGNQLHLTSWEELPEVAQRLVLQHWLEQRLPAIKQQLVAELMAGLKNHVAPQQSWALPNGYQLVKDYQSCQLVPTQKNHGKGQNGLSTVVELGQWYRVSDQRAIQVIAAKDDTVGQSSGQEMWLAPDQLPLRLRLWRAGDALRLKQGGHQLVRRILIDQKVSNSARQAQVVLVDAHDEPVWLVGRKWAWFTRPADYRQRWRHVLISMKEV